MLLRQPRDRSGVWGKRQGYKKIVKVDELVVHVDRGSILAW